MATADTPESPSNEALEALYEQVMQCSPVIDKDDLDRVANLVFSKEQVIREWRLTALLAIEGGEFYQDLSLDEEKAKTFVPVAGSLSDFAKLLREMADLADCVSSRVLVAGCNHERFVDWMNAPA